MSAKKSRFGYALESEVLAQPEKTEVLAIPSELAYKAKLAGEGSAAHAMKEPSAYVLPPQRKGKAAVEGVVRRSDLPREQLNIRIRPELKRAAAAVAALQGLTLGDVVEAALIRYIEQSQDGAE